MYTEKKNKKVLWPKVTPKDRLKEFIEFKGLNNSQFEKMCGLSNGYVNNIKYQPSRLKLEQIVKVFPELNYMWLVNGEGTMIATPEDMGRKDEIVEKNIEINRLLQEIEHLKSEIRLRDELLASQRETIELYRQKVAESASPKKNEVFPAVGLYPGETRG